MTAIFKKIIKRTTAALLLLATLVAVFVGVLGGKTLNAPRSVSPIVASAEEIRTQKPLEDANFAFEEGGALWKAGDNLNALSFTLKLKNKTLRDFNDKHSQRTYLFTLYRETEKQVNTAVSQIVFSWNGQMLFVYTVQLEHYADPIAVNFDFDGYSLEDNIPGEFERYKDEYAKENKNLLYVGVDVWDDYDAEEYNITQDLRYVDDPNGNFGFLPHLRFVVYPNSNTMNYFCSFNYYIKEYTHTSVKGWFNKRYTHHYKAPIQGTIDSSSRSIRGILQLMKDDGMLETEFDGRETLLEEAREILGKMPRWVSVRYLRRIGDLPFATSVTESVEIPMYDGQTVIPVDDVAVALNKPGFLCLNSFAKEFKQTENDNIFEAVYAKSIYLYVTSADGNSPDLNEIESSKYFLDINLSHYEYYTKLINAGILPKEIQEKMYNDLLLDFPILNNIPSDNLYGYFGYCSIPQTYTISSLWSTMFDQEKSFDGTIRKFEYMDSLSYTNYIKLLDEFGYSYIQIAWNVLGIDLLIPWGTPKAARTVLFYADSFKKDVVISENGADHVGDTDGAFQDWTEDTTEEAVKKTEGIFDELFDDNVTRKDVNTFFGLFGVTVLVVVGLWIYLKIKFRRR